MPRMLIVDDEVDICDLLEQYFQARGFLVSSAFSGEEALNKLAEGNVEVLLLDINLPGIHGIEVLRRVKQLYPNVRVVMVTALPDPDLKSQAKRLGACGYVNKPFDFSETTWAPVFGGHH